MPDIKIVPNAVEDRDLYVIRVRPDIYLRLAGAAAQDRITMNDLAERAIEELLDRNYIV